MNEQPGYFTEKWRGYTKFQCRQCAFDSFHEPIIQEHCRLNHKPIVMPELEVSLEDWAIQEREKGRLRGKKIALGFITWNQEYAAKLAATALVEEMDRLEALGIRTRIIWVDNGSVDGTRGTLSNIFPQKKTDHCLFPENQGAAIGRNKIIDMANRWGAEYLLFLDGDIEPVPYSVYALTVFLSQDLTLGCMGFFPNNCSEEITPNTSLDCRVIHPWRVKYDLPVALTQYGVFRTKVFFSCKFDEKFGPGWGLEDDDLYIQMEGAAWRVGYDPSFHYLHRRLHSSIPFLGKQWTLDNFEERRHYIMEKWRRTPWATKYLNRVSAIDIRHMVASL